MQEARREPLDLPGWEALVTTVIEETPGHLEAWLRTHPAREHLDRLSTDIARMANRLDDMGVRVERHRTTDIAPPPPAAPDGEHFGMVPAWCAAETDLDEARKATHDALIALMGERREGPVEWMWFTGDDAIDRIRAFAGEGLQLGETDRGRADTPKVREYARQLEQLLSERGGFLVFAIANGRL